METFDKYAFLEQVQEGIKEDKPDSVWEYIYHEIDNAVIYYADCVAIISELRFFNWENHDLGNFDSINQLAWAALNDFVAEELKTDWE